MNCPRCQHENRPAAKFCEECGAALAGQALAPRPQPPPGGEGERRQLTVMFCDLAGSTALSEQLDPEDLREVVRAYQEMSAAVISRFEGQIAKYLGDGLLVYFGYPLAHEDDAQRAVRTGLGILSELPPLNDRLRETVAAMRGLSLQARIGIHTGLVVVGEMGTGEYREPMAIVGDTPNLAARLQEIARPDTVAISSATHRLTQGFFECLDLGAHRLKGISAPVPVYQVLGESGVRSRLEVAAATGLTPLVGREREAALLRQRWEEVQGGTGHAVLLSGEAGIGKSRLVQVLKERIAGEPHPWLQCQCSPYHQNSSLYPLIDLLQRGMEWKRDDSPQEKLRKLEKMLAQYRFSLPEVVPLFASLLSLPLPEGGYPPLTLHPERQRQETLKSLLYLLRETAARHPLLFVVEDVHWADPSTLEFLGLLLDQESGTRAAGEARILTLLTFRPDFHPPWSGGSHLTPMTLGQLPREQAETLVNHVAGGKALPAEVLQQLVTKTDGIPLFVEELTKTVLESGLLREKNGEYELTGPLPLSTIPATLHDSLMARLDRLGAVREVAALGATLGREFSDELLQAISPLDERTLYHSLDQLVAAGLLYQRGRPPQATYVFKHALIQEAAYQSLLKSKRQQVHQRIAQVLAEQFPETAELQPELLAHHFTAAGLHEQAIAYWQQAGQRAIEHSANVEAISHLTRGLELLELLPDTPERMQQELTLQVALAVPLRARRGFAAPEVGQVYARARELCRLIGETPQLFSVLRGLWSFSTVRAEHETAHELARQLLALAERAQDVALLLSAHHTQGVTLYHLGEFTSARAYLEQVIALYVPQEHHSLAFLYGEDPAVACLSWSAAALWFLGYPEQALKRSHQALGLAERLSHPFSLGFALCHAAILHQYRREQQAALARAEAVLALATEQGYPAWLAWATFLRGRALAEQGQPEEGIAQMRRGLEGWQAAGSIARPTFVGLLADACGKAGRIEAGLDLLAEALAAVDRTGERYYEAELYRLQGELLQRQSADAAEVEACFRHAIGLARSQSAKSWELRAGMSLSRLWWRQGRSEEARELLAEIYGWFTEGFETADLKEAGVLLEALS